MPQVSVVIPTYNRADVLQRAIDSVFAQSFDGFEIVVVDDGSTDETEDVVRQYESERINYIQFEKNRGANAARNAGIGAARGNLVSFLDSDDELMPDHLKRVVDEFRRAPRSLGGVFTGFEILEDGDRIDVSATNPGEITMNQLITDYVTGGFSCCTVRSSVFEQVGMLDESLPACQDREFFIRLREYYDMRGIDEILVRYHRGPDRISSSKQRRLKGLDLLIQKHGDKFTQSEMAHVHYSRAFIYTRNGELETARRHFAKAFRTEPTNGKYLFHLLVSFLGNRVFEMVIDLKRRAKLVGHDTLDNHS